jgi:hypothetical protein
MYYISSKNEMEVRKKVVVGAEEADQIYWPGMGVDLDKWVNGII